MKTWINFEEAGTSPSGKTLRFRVVAKDGGTLLGLVLWYSPWRRYSFSPASMTVFETDCLRTIADFCEAQTHQHRARKKS